MTFPPLTSRLLAALCALAFATAVYAEKGDRDKPISFTSDDGEVNYEKRSGVLKGNVVITQGTLTIKADRIDFKQNPDNSLSATAIGKPLSFRQKRDGAEGWYEGWAMKADYNGQTEQLELFDNAILKRGADEIRSNYISYNSTSGIFRAEGRPDTPGAANGPGSKVRGTFQPKSDSPLSKGAGKDSRDKGVDAKDNTADGKDKSPEPRGTSAAKAAAPAKAPVALKPAAEPSKP